MGRALTLLGAACSEASPDELASLSIGRRDADLLALREGTFGSEMAGVAVCPRCGEQLELLFGVAQIRQQSVAQAGQAFALTVDGYQLQVRPPNSMDLAAIGAQHDASLRRRLLLERCLIAVHREATPVATDELPANVIIAVEEGIARADPQADIRLAISCPACDHRWEGVFDILSFFWSEIEAWAARILHEVHILASAYGWREHDILALSARRRQFYLEMAGG
ncbi:MAG: phage baseplate protein [Solirubrobacteraceae bacterium]